MQQQGQKQRVQQKQVPYWRHLLLLVLVLLLALLPLLLRVLLALLRVAALLQEARGFVCYWRLGWLRLGFGVLQLRVLRGLPLRVWVRPHQS
jgi:hypothetical protein